MDYDLIPGEIYEIISDRSDSSGVFSEAGYIRKEFLPSTNQEWETFATTMPIGIEEVLLYRIRIPVNSIENVEGNEIISNFNPPFWKRIWNDQEHTPIVQNWLDEVSRLFPPTR
jgi:hypothetical protein